MPALGADGAEMLTQDNPSWRASDRRLGVFLFVFVGIKLVAMDLWLWQHPGVRLRDYLQEGVP